MASENQHDLSQTPCPGCDSAPPPSPLGVLYRTPLGPAAGARQECDFFILCQASLQDGLPPRCLQAARTGTSWQPGYLGQALFLQCLQGPPWSLPQGCETLRPREVRHMDGLTRQPDI